MGGGGHIIELNQGEEERILVVCSIIIFFSSAVAVLCVMPSHIFSLYAFSESLQYHIPHIFISVIGVRWMSEPQYCTSYVLGLSKCMDKFCFLRIKL